MASKFSLSDITCKKKYRYRFNIIKDYEGDKVILKNGLICYFYDFNELENVLKAVQEEKQNKIKKYGLNNYKLYMQSEKEENELFKRFKQVKGEN